MHRNNICDHQCNLIMAKEIKQKKNLPNKAEEEDQLARFLEKNQLQNKALKKILENLDQSDKTKS